MTFKSWFLTSEKKDQVAELGSGGGVRWFGQSPKENVFFPLTSSLKTKSQKSVKKWQTPLPLMISALKFSEKMIIREYHVFPISYSQTLAKVNWVQEADAKWIEKTGCSVFWHILVRQASFSKYIILEQKSREVLMIFHKKTLLLNKQKVHIKDQMKIEACGSQWNGGIVFWTFEENCFSARSLFSPPLY